MAFEEVKRIAQLLHSYAGSWAIAGGWAIDLFLNKETRKHTDVDIFLIREEQLKFKHYLQDWTFRYVEQGTLVDWNTNQFLHLPIHELQATHQGGKRIEVLLNEVIEGEWKFRRNPIIRAPMEQTIVKSPLGIWIVSPQVVLLYKAKSNLAKDRADLETVLPSLQRDAVKWLKQAIKETYGNHPWIAALQHYT
jgi:hypothetical protein